MRWRCIRLKQNIPSKCPDSKPARSERRNATKRPDRESSVGRASARLCVENRRLRRAAVSRGPGDPRLIRDARKGWQSGVGGQDSLTRSFHGSARQTGRRLSRGLHLCAQTKGFRSPGLSAWVGQVLEKSGGTARITRRFAARPSGRHRKPAPFRRIAVRCSGRTWNQGIMSSWHKCLIG